MAGYVIADVEIQDAAGFQEYAALVPATIEKYGGKYLVRGGKTEVMEGDYQTHRVVILEFPTFERAKEWYNSAEYQPLIAMRQRAAKTNVILVEGV